MHLSTSRRFIAIVTIVTFFASLVARGLAADRPNIVLFYVDDLGWKDVGFMGSSCTPTFGRIRRAGCPTTLGF